jgi:hypothetical protein
MPAETFDEFMARYNPGGTHPVTEITAPLSAERNTSPFVIVRAGRYTAIVNPLPFEEYLDIDVHSFADGRKAAAGVLGMTQGRRVALQPTGLTSAGAPAAGLVIVLIGEQGTEPVAQTLNVSIPLTSTMRTPDDLADALRQIASAVQSGTGTGQIRGKTGSSAGSFDITG